MYRILYIGKFLFPAKNSQCTEFCTLDRAGIDRWSYVFRSTRLSASYLPAGSLIRSNPMAIYRRINCPLFVFILDKYRPIYPEIDPDLWTL